MNVRSRILSNIQPDRLRDLLLDLIGVYSPSYAEEDAIELLAEALSASGISVRLQSLEPGGESDRSNLIIRMGPEPVELLLIGHVDTIDLWYEGRPKAHMDSGRVFGLGAADMKGGCAALVEALRAVSASEGEWKRGLAVAFVVGEEHYGDGAQAVKDLFRPSLAVIGEPTGLRPCLSHYSYVEVRLAGSGLRAHAALPEIGANAIHAVLEWILQIINQAQDLPWAEHLSINPREIEGGESGFFVPEICEALIDFHLPPEASVDDIRAMIERARQQTKNTHLQVELTSEEVFNASGFSGLETDIRLGPLKTAFTQTGLPWVPGVFRSHSDAVLFTEPEILPVVCGPGNLKQAHRRGEYVELNEVEAAARLYSALIYSACLEEGSCRLS